MAAEHHPIARTAHFDAQRARAYARPQRTMEIPCVPARSAAQKRAKAGPLMLAACLALAVAAVLLIPLIVGGATAPGAAATPAVAAAAVGAPAEQYKTLEEAMEAVGAKVKTPAQPPAGYAASAYAVLDGRVLEITYTNKAGSIIYRTAMGSDDLSGRVYDGYAFTATETGDGVARGYAGDAADKLNVAVWAHRGQSYAIVADAGLAGDELRRMAESVA